MKKLIGLALISLAAISLAGCGQQSETQKEAVIVTNFEKQVQTAKAEQDAQKKVFEDTFKTAKIEGDNYTFTNNTKYTFQSIQLAWTEYDKNNNPVYLSDSYSQETKDIKPNQTFTLKAYSSNSKTDHLKVTKLVGQISQ